MNLSDLERLDWQDLPEASERALFTRSESPSPYIIYLILKNSFGPGTEEEDSEKVQWSYLLKAPGGYLEIHDWLLDSWSLETYAEQEDEQKAQLLEKEFLSLISQEAMKYERYAKQPREKATSYILSNPYTIYYEDAKRLTQLAEDGVSKKNLNPWSPDFSTSHLICRSAFLAFMSAFEGFLNLIYELYLRPDLRDVRLYERLSREQIDLKIRLAPAYCVCFKDGTILYASDELARFQYLTKVRNDFVHANLVDSMRTVVAIEDNFNFLLYPSTEGKYGFPSRLDAVDLDNLRFVQAAIDDMVYAVVRSMRPRYRKEMETILRDDEISIELVDDEFIVQ